MEPETTFGRNAQRDAGGQATADIAKLSGICRRQLAGGFARCPQPCFLAFMWRNRASVGGSRQGGGIERNAGAAHQSTHRQHRAIFVAGQGQIRHFRRRAWPGGFSRNDHRHRARVREESK